MTNMIRFAVLLFVGWRYPGLLVYLLLGIGLWRYLRWGLWLDEPPPYEMIDWKMREGWL